MTKHFIIGALLCMSLSAGYSQTASQWQEDLTYLQKTVHSKYSNLFYNISEKDWDKAVDEFYNNIPNLEKTSIVAGFAKLVALFHIGHTQIATWALHQGHNPFLHHIPAQFQLFNDGLYIIGADKKYAQAVGGKVIQLGKMKTDDALKAIRAVTPFENEQGFADRSMFFLGIPEFLYSEGISGNANEVTITYSKNGQEGKVTFLPAADLNMHSTTGLEVPEGWASAKKEGQIPLWQKEPKEFRYMEYIPASKTLYVRHSVTLNDGDKSISAFFRNMSDYIDKNDVQRLVLDIRMNGGGNNYLNKDIITSIIASRKVNQKGKFFCIIGRKTFSAAQNLTNELEKYTEVTFVGEPTSENVNFYGDTKTETLPNSKLQANLSWLWWQNLDARDKRKATSPSIAADMSFNDYHNNIDPAMNMIMNFEQQKPLLPTLSALISAGKREEAIKFAQEYVQDPSHRYSLDRIEPDINNEGYTAMAQNKLNEANGLFEINVKLFPESANACDSYAESFMNLGKNEEALKYYAMAIAKDKDGGTAENSKKMIDKIRSGAKN